MNRVAAGLDRWIWITGWRDVKSVVQPIFLWCNNADLSSSRLFARHRFCASLCPHGPRQRSWAQWPPGAAPPGPPPCRGAGTGTRQAPKAPLSYAVASLRGCPRRWAVRAERRLLCRVAAWMPNPLPPWRCVGWLGRLRRRPSGRRSARYGSMTRLTSATARTVGFTVPR